MTNFGRKITFFGRIFSSSWIKLVKNVTVSSTEISRGMKFRWNFRVLSEFPQNLEKIKSSLCYSSYESEIDMHRQKTNSPILSVNSERDGDLISTNSFRSNYHKRISDVIDRNQCNSSKKAFVLNFDTLKPGENEFFVEIDVNLCFFLKLMVFVSVVCCISAEFLRNLSSRSFTFLYRFFVHDFTNRSIVIALFR